MPLFERRALMCAALASLTLGLASLGFASSGLAQAPWPNRAVTVMVPFVAGSNTDTAARIFTDRLQARLGQPFVIENRAGAGGATGIRALTRSTADGYNIGVVTAGTLNILPHLYGDKLGYDSLADIKPIAVVGYQPNILVVHPGMPVTNVAEFVAHVAANPNKYSYGTSGLGTSQHLCMELIVQATGLKLTHVPYRGSNQIMQDLIAGHVHMSCDQFSSAIAQVRGGNARAIAVSSLTRYPAAPDVPALAETFPGLDVTWAAVFIAPAGIPKEAADRLTAELVAITKEPDVQRRLSELGVTPMQVVGQELEAQVRADFIRWKPLVERANIPAP